MPIRSPRQAWREGGRLWRGRLIVYAAAFAGLSGVFAILTILQLNGVIKFQHFWFAAPPGTVVLSQGIIWFRERRTCRLVAANKSAVCWQCWYPLADVESDRCPECGIPFDREALRLAWTKALYPR